MVGFFSRTPDVPERLSRGPLNPRPIQRAFMETINYIDHPAWDESGQNE
jgi:hypothetical protein